MQKGFQRINNQVKKQIEKNEDNLADRVRKTIKRKGSAWLRPIGSCNIKAGLAVGNYYLLQEYVLLDLGAILYIFRDILRIKNLRAA